MGQDIHAFVEVKIDSRWHTHTVLEIYRNYRLFGKIAGTRHPCAIVESRGIPDDLGAVTRVFCENSYGGHTHGWLTLEEIAQVESWWLEEFPSTKPIFGGLLHNLRLDCYHKLFDDARLVFWFDS